MQYISSQQDFRIKHKISVHESKLSPTVLQHKPFPPGERPHGPSHWTTLHPLSQSRNCPPPPSQQQAAEDPVHWNIL